MRATLLSFLPDSLIPVVMLALIVAAGCCRVLQMRRASNALLLSGITLPFWVFLLDVLIEEVANVLPWPLLIATVVLFGLALLTRLMHGGVALLSNKATADATMAHLFADAIRGVLRFALIGPFRLLWAILRLAVRRGRTGP